MSSPFPSSHTESMLSLNQLFLEGSKAQWVAGIHWLSSLNSCMLGSLSVLGKNQRLKSREEREYYGTPTYQIKQTLSMKSQNGHLYLKL